MVRLYVGNLPYSVNSENELVGVFTEAGIVVQNAKLIRDRESGAARGFAFLEVEDADATKALEARLEMGGRTLRIDRATEQERRGGGGGNRGGGGGGRDVWNDDDGGDRRRSRGRR